MQHPLAKLDAAGVEALLHFVLAEAPVLGGAADLSAQPDLFQTLGGHLANKAARLVEHLAAVDAAALRITDVELLHGAGHAHVTEAPLLLQAARLLGGLLAGEHALLHTDQQHQGIFQALGAVQGHQLHRIGVFVRLILAGLQRRVGEEGGEIAHVFQLVRALVLAAGGDQFVQVLYPRLGFLAFFRQIHGLEAGVLNGDIRLLVQGQQGDLLLQRVDQLDKAAHRVAGAAGQHLVVQQGLGRLPQVEPLIPGIVAQYLEGAIADATGRGVDHPLEAGVVAAVVDKAQVGHGVLDLLALEEAQAAVDAIGHGVLHQRLLQHPGLGVGAIEDGAVGEQAALFLPVLEAADHEAGLVHLVEGGVQRDRLALGALGPQLLAQALRVVGDDAVGGFEDVGGGAVVLLEANGLGALIVGQEALDVLDLGAAPAIDGLVVVADDHHLAGVAGQHPQPGVLDAVGILEFVHQDVLEAVAVVLEDVGLVQPQLVGPQQEFGKIHQTGAIAGLLIGLVDLLIGAGDGVAIDVDVAGAQPLVLLAVDVAHHGAGSPVLLVEVERLEHPANEAVLVVGVEDLEVLGQARIQMVGPQQSVGDAVEGADPHAAHAVAYHLLDPATHLGRRLVGKGHRDDGEG